MFYGLLKVVDNEVTLSDVPVDAFLTFLRFLYTDVAEIGTGNVMECLKVGHQYRVPDFVQNCETNLMMSINDLNVTHLLEASITLNLQMLKTQCMDYVKGNTLSVITSTAFLYLSQDALATILCESGLQAPELKIYKAVNSWADKACESGGVLPSHRNKREFLGDAFFNLRLGHIPQSDFASVVLTENLLSKDEMLMFFRLHHDESVSKLDFVENAKRAGTVINSVPAQLSQSRRRIQTQSLETCFNFNREVNLVGINITEQTRTIQQNSGFCHVLSVLLLEENSKSSTKKSADIAMYLLERDECKDTSTCNFDIIFDQAFPLKRNGNYVLCISIVYSDFYLGHNAGRGPCKITAGNKLVQTYDGRKYIRHPCQGSMKQGLQELVTIQSLLTVE